MTIQERVISLNAGGCAAEGLLVLDDDPGDERPGVLVCHTIRGRTQFEDDKARALAGLGYVALSVDLYGVETRGGDIGVMRELMNGWRADRPGLQRRLHDWLDELRRQPEVNRGKIAAMGFCFGGLCVLDLARTGADIAGVASFHGIFDPPGNTAANRILAKVLALHGWDDPLAKPDAVVALAEELTAQGADWQIHGYGNTLHAFTNPAADDKNAGTVYNASANRRSWTALQNFLSELFGD
ncbi:MAG: dienelactone hydrolase family protein [Woeseiaceae bacterium]|nr:dienelactone hydrolase family protein [Woeseiaceae bacterium]